MTRKIALVLPVLLAAGCSCCQDHKPTTQSAATTQPAYPVIVSVVSRHDRVIISAGPREPLYSVKTDAGQTLVANATLADLRDQHPEIYQRVQPLLVVHADMDLDASAR